MAGATVSIGLRPAAVLAAPTATDLHAHRDSICVQKRSSSALSSAPVRFAAQAAYESLRSHRHKICPDSRRNWSPPRRPSLSFIRGLLQALSPPKVDEVVTW